MYSMSVMVYFWIVGRPTFCTCRKKGKEIYLCVL